MKIFKRLFLIAFAVVFVVFLSGFASQENNGAAIISEDGICGMPDPSYFSEGSLLAGKSYFGSVMSVTNHGGNTTMICKADGIGTGVKRDLSGFICFTPYGATADSYVVVSASGNATMRCQIKKSKN